MSKEIKAEWLHLYPGAHWHDDASIVGTREGLTELRDALNAALQDGNAVASAVVRDGECYCVFVHVVEFDEMKKMALPYTDEAAMELEGSDAIWPQNLEDRAADAYREKFLRPNDQVQP